MADGSRRGDQSDGKSAMPTQERRQDVGDAAEKGGKNCTSISISNMVLIDVAPSSPTNGPQ
jgi:hypothetical protein